MLTLHLAVAAAFAFTFCTVLPAGRRGAFASGSSEASGSTTSLVKELLTGTIEDADRSLKELTAHWQTGYVPMLLESLRFAGFSGLAAQIIETLERNTGQALGFDTDAWLHWLWSQGYKPHSEYASFKAWLYGNIDPAFSGYFSDLYAARIRLDEIRWGGVRQDGIPPLRGPAMIAAEEATYLMDDNIVFGLEIHGDARAYPQRILAWHEMFVDRVGGEPVTGVYCTLCGAMILYYSAYDGIVHDLGTSGFLYRSNKLMYDEATQSLWSSLKGRPMVGALADANIQLKRGSVVTTTWGEWKRRHPQTTVLSLETGHTRDYSEGAAYRDYFKTDELMFTVP